MLKERNTKQKEIIRCAVMQSCCHPTAEQVYELVSSSLPGVSLATVYRNLNRLASDGKILRITVPDRSDRYDKTVREHCHFRCEVCGSVSDFPEGDLPLPEIVTERTVTGRQIIYTGICAECKHDK